jgi:hypothetical protein
VTHFEISSRRMASQGLSTSPFTDAAEVVRTLVAMQSQEYAAAKWSVGERATGVDEGDVERAIAEGAILRTHVLRPTWHFVAREDLRWLMELSGPRVHSANAAYYRKAELDDAFFVRSHDLITRALEGGNHLTRREIAEVLGRDGIDASEGQRLAYVVMRAELDRVLCSGAPRGKEQTYALFDERVPGGTPLSPDEALAELTRRYFTTRGPATVKDYRWWSGLTAAQARRGLEMVGGELERMVADGREYWLAGSAAEHREPTPTAHLVQAYDETIIAYSESRGAMDVAGLSKDVVGRQIPFLHVLLVDGQLAGRWRRKVTAKEMAVEVLPARALSKRERGAVERAAENYGRFCGIPAAVVYF